MSNSQPVLYGADWCLKTSGFRNFLQREWVDFTYHDVEKNEEAAQRVRDHYDGQLKFPVLEIDDVWLKNPGMGELRDVLKQKKLI
ncbi:glutaredoxin family protein [Tunicatimonas pelagia]|uniref:glutaredoxin family protein n=1 Tax=Tunicatimonas pelagia TaxID=931531 RepID=UPI002666F1BC|nr:glutaredoxin domain-containing protein [Tunicatimonas pelagia]WKN42190.1 glutaredoxin domain-containing protein [Tunicatimonas pelagia]